MTQDELNQLADALADRVVASVFSEILPQIEKMLERSDALVTRVHKYFNESVERLSGQGLAKEICASFEKQITQFLEQRLGEMLDLRVEKHVDRVTETFLATRSAVTTTIARKR